GANHGAGFAAAGIACQSARQAIYKGRHARADPRPGPRRSDGLVERRPPTGDPRPPRAGRHPRLLDLLLHQLPARLAGAARSRGAAPRRSAGGDRRALCQVRCGEGPRSHPRGDAALRRLAPGRRRQRDAALVPVCDRSWPTLVVLAPDGTLAAVAPGEPDPSALEALVSEQLARARAGGTLARAPLRLARTEKRDEGTLSFPGKVVSTSHGRIVISDSGHHRVLLLGADGAVQDTVGSGLRGHREGSFAEAALDDPQGLALAGDSLYIADARAHAVFRADLRERTLQRLAGTYELGRAPLSSRTQARDTPLRSPWDLAL